MENAEKFEKLYSSLSLIENYRLDTESILKVASSLSAIGNYSLNTESLNRISQSMSKMLASAIPALSTYSIQETMKTIANSLPKISEYYASPVLSESTKLAMQRLLQISDSFVIDHKETIDKLTEKLSGLQLEQIGQLKNIDFNSVFSNIAYEIANEQIGDSEEETNIEDLQESYQAEIEEKVGWQEWLYNKSEAFQKKYYVYYQILQIIKFFIGIVVSFYIGEALAKGFVKEEPASNTTIIYNITQETPVTIIGDVNYYYEINFTTSDGEEITGYIAKRNVKTSVSGNDLNAESNETEDNCEME